MPVIIRRKAHPLRDPQDLDPFMRRIGDARIVMLGEASHGTHEYYTWRSHISKRLITEKGFSFIAVEGDWPDCYRVNRFIKGYTDEASAAEVLRYFDRWPTWMWANREIVALASWLRRHNTSLSGGKRTGFCGLDLYSLRESMESIMQYLDVEGMSPIETMDASGITESNVKVRLSRARTMLREKLSGYYKNDFIYPFHLGRSHRMVQQVLALVDTIG